ncbi:hypothetical protein B0H11DRAFT_2292193 [Mycena galericulata]|nr:hypothetical protein B0H11DRAFT_2292193 [Mycena galericulata]
MLLFLSPHLPSPRIVVLARLTHDSMATRLDGDSIPSHQLLTVCFLLYAVFRVTVTDTVFDPKSSGRLPGDDGEQYLCPMQARFSPFSTPDIPRSEPRTARMATKAGVATDCSSRPSRIMGVGGFLLNRAKDLLPSGFRCNTFLIDARRSTTTRVRPSLQKDQHPRPVYLLSLLSTSYCPTIGADLITESLPSPSPSPTGVDAMCQRA